MTDCPCGSGQLFEQCCELYIRDEKLPPSPEALMRSRYTAYYTKQVDYIVKTNAGPAGKGFDVPSVMQWLDNIEWIDLKVVDAMPVQAGDAVGFVEFIARFRERGDIQSIHEISEFRFIDDRWFYFDGKVGSNS